MTEWSDLPVSQLARAKVAFIKFCDTYGLDASENPMRSCFLNHQTQNGWLLWQASWVAALKMSLV